jgi:hypothetical protein
MREEPKEKIDNAYEVEKWTSIGKCNCLQSLQIDIKGMYEEETDIGRKSALYDVLEYIEDTLIKNLKICKSYEQN